jgi:hypothetical protein
MRGVEGDRPKKIAGTRHAYATDGKGWCDAPKVRVLLRCAQGEGTTTMRPR